MPYPGKDPESYEGKTVGTGQCVAFVQKVAQAPVTRFWKDGIKIKGALLLAKGTAITTFQNGKYQNSLNGNSHAAIYIDQDLTGINVWDQWSGHAVSKRHISFKGE